MRKLAASVLVAAAAVLLTLAAVIVLVAANIRTSAIGNPLLRGLASGAQLLTGIVWLLGTVYVATHMAVVIFKDKSGSRV